MREPWRKALGFPEGDPGPDVDLTIFLTAESIRIVSILLQPYMPNKSAQLLDQLGVAPERRSLEWAQPGKDLDYGNPQAMEKDEPSGLFPPLPRERFGW